MNGTGNGGTPRLAVLVGAADLIEGAAALRATPERLTGEVGDPLLESARAAFDATVDEGRPRLLAILAWALVCHVDARDRAALVSGLRLMAAHGLDYAIAEALT